MRLGINTFLFTSPFTNESTKLFPQFKKWGFETVEIPIEDPSHIDPAHVKAELEKNGLVCGSVCACMGPDRDLRGTPETAAERRRSTCRRSSTRWWCSVAELDRAGLLLRRPGGRSPAEEYKQQWKTVVKQSEDSLQVRREKAAIAWSRSTASRPTSSTPATRD